MPASRKLLILGLFVLISLLTRGLFLHVEVLDIDESAHAVGSWIFMDGKLLYTDFVNNKPPLLYVYYALAQWMFGRGLIAVHLFTALFTIPFTAFGASSFFEHSRKGIIAGLLFLLFSAAFFAHDMHSSNTEILMILPGTWALVFVRTEERVRKLIQITIAGFLLGVGVLLKYQIAAWLGPIALTAAWIFWKEKQIRKMDCADGADEHWICNPTFDDLRLFLFARWCGCVFILDDSKQFRVFGKSDYCSRSIRTRRKLPVPFSDCNLTSVVVCMAVQKSS